MDEGKIEYKTISVEVSPIVYKLLETLTKGEYAPNSVEAVVGELIDHAQQGVYRPGAWERGWLTQAFGEDWIDHLEPGDPYGHPSVPDDLLTSVEMLEGEGRWPFLSNRIAHLPLQRRAKVAGGGPDLRWTTVSNGKPPRKSRG